MFGSDSLNFRVSVMTSTKESVSATSPTENGNSLPEKTDISGKSSSEFKVSFAYSALLNFKDSCEYVSWQGNKNTLALIQRLGCMGSSSQSHLSPMFLTSSYFRIFE